MITHTEGGRERCVYLGKHVKKHFDLDDVIS